MAIHTIAALFVFLMSGWLVYLPSIHGERIWDDLYLIGENPFFRSPVFGLEVFRHWLFFDSFSTYYRPVQNWSYIFDYWLWRGEPSGYHTTNILLHSISGFLLYLLLRRLLPGLIEKATERCVALVSLLVALVWTVHPIHNAAVAYISGRADSLASVFALAAWLLALRAAVVSAGPRRIALASVSAICCLLALCSKEIGLMWVALFTLHLVVFQKGIEWRRRIAPLSVAVGVCLVYFALHALPARRVPMEDGPPPPIEARAILMLRALGDYSGLILYPGTLHMERTLSDPATLRSAESWRNHLRADHLSMLGMLAIVGVVALCRVKGPGQRLRSFGGLWFAAAFLPISNLFPLNAEVAEHWIYLASIGFLIFLAACLLALPARWQPLVVGLVIVAGGGLGLRTAVRAADWVDPVTFCQRTIASGGVSPRVLATLASHYADRGDYGAQERLLRKTIEHFPAFAPARVQLGICLQRQGRSEDAATWLAVAPAKAERDARQYPRTWPAALHFARLRAESGDAAEAREILRVAREQFPEPWLLVECHARLLIENEGASAACDLVQKYATSHWWHLEAWQMLGELRAELGAREEALDAFRHASRLDLYDPRPLKAIARVELERGFGEAAIEAQCAAIQRQPGKGDGYLALAAILESLGRKSEAEAAVRMARGLSARL